MMSAQPEKLAEQLPVTTPLAGDDSRHRAAMTQANPPESEQLLRVPVRIVADGRVIEGAGAIDTGCSTSAVDDSLGLASLTTTTDTAMCACGKPIRIQRLRAVLSVDGAEVENPFALPLKASGLVALVGLDILAQCSFTYSDGRFTLEQSRNG